MKKNWVLLVVLIVIAAGVWWFYQSGSGTSVWTPTSSPVASATQQASKASVRRTPTPMPSSTPVMSYSQLVQQYGNDRIQFDQNCQAQPKSIVLKNGTKVMLDNRSSQTRSVTVNGTKYQLGAYGYQLITLSSPSIPQTLSLGCDNLVNVGTVQLEANISGQ